MPFTFRPAKRDRVALLIGIAGGTGSGKTYTAMRLASGMAGSERFAVIDSEAGRATHYSDQFKFDHGDLCAPFTPEAYLEAIIAADSAGYPVIVIDSFSHEHESEGGLLEMHEAELKRMAGDDYKKREACTQAAWISVKGRHKKMVQRILQLRTPMIFCMRAEEKVEMVRDPETRKMKMVPKQSLVGLGGWIPISEKRFPFELTASFLVTADAPGYPKPIKLQEQHRELFPLDKPINEESGRRIAEWASGGLTPSATQSDAHTIAIQAAETMAQLADVFAVAQKEARTARDAVRLSKYVQLKEERKTVLENIPTGQIATQQESQP